jgi:hypothetical protein
VKYDCFGRKTIEIAYLNEFLKCSCIPKSLNFAVFLNFKTENNGLNSEKDEKPLIRSGYTDRALLYMP